MKSWKCPECHRSKETEDDVVMVVCKCCQVKMLSMKNERRCRIRCKNK